MYWYSLSLSFPPPFSAPSPGRMEESSVDHLTREDGGVLCGPPYLGGWRSPLWTALPGLPCHLASRWFGPWEVQAEDGEGVGAFLLPFLHCSYQRQWFCWVAPLSWLWPSLGSSYLIPLLPSAPRRQEMWRQEGWKWLPAVFSPWVLYQTSVNNPSIKLSSVEPFLSVSSVSFQYPDSYKL